MIEPVQALNVLDWYATQCSADHLTGSMLCDRSIQCDKKLARANKNLKIDQFKSKPSCLLGKMT
jgi:hypothetical protein